MTQPRQRAAFNRRRFTHDNVFRLKPRKKQYLVWDEGGDSARGLAILISPTGTRSFRCVFYYPGSPKAHWKHLGRVDEVVDLEEARRLTREARGMARRGDDPKAGDVLRSDAFRSAVEAYVRHEQIGRHGNKSALPTQAMMLSQCKAWASRPVATIRYQEIEALLSVIRDGDGTLKPRPPTANRLYAHLKDFFGWAVRTKLIKESPMTGMERPSAQIAHRDRDWFKKTKADQAIKSLWGAADQIGGSGGKFIKLMLLTGKRIGALKDVMTWDQIDNNWFWDAPTSPVKNKRLHGIPLPVLPTTPEPA